MPPHENEIIQQAKASHLRSGFGDAHVRRCECPHNQTELLWTPGYIPHAVPEPCSAEHILARLHSPVICHVQALSSAACQLVEDNGPLPLRPCEVLNPFSHANAALMSIAGFSVLSAVLQTVTLAVRF